MMSPTRYRRPAYRHQALHCRNRRPINGGCCRPDATTAMASTTSETFAALLRRRRLAAGLTQEALAERAGISARGVQDLERGLRATPRPDTIRLLADALDL